MVSPNHELEQAPREGVESPFAPALDEAKKAEREEKYGLARRAILAYCAFVVAAALIVAGLITFVWLGPDSSKTERRYTNESGEQVTEITQTNHSQSITVLLAALGALGSGGALAIPLKFLWDELSNRAESRRQLEANVRNRLHSYVEKYYMPMAFSLNDLADQSDVVARRLESGQDPPSGSNQHLEITTIEFDRWLFSLAEVWAVHRAMRHDGGSWFFRSHAGEDQAAQAFKHLRRIFDARVGRDGRERSVLASAIHGLDPRDLAGFRARLQPVPYPWMPDPWRELRELRERLFAASQSQDLASQAVREIGDAARHTKRLIVFYATEIYSAWYRDSLDKGMLAKFGEARMWLQGQDKVQSDLNGSG